MVWGKLHSFPKRGRQEQQLHCQLGKEMSAPTSCSKYTVLSTCLEVLSALEVAGRVPVDESVQLEVKMLPDGRGLGG